MSPSASPWSTLQKLIFFSCIWTPLESRFLKHVWRDRCVVKFLFLHNSKPVESFIFNICCSHTMEDMFEQFCAHRHLRWIYTTYFVLCIKELLIVVLRPDFHSSDIKTDCLPTFKVNSSMQWWNNFLWRNQIICLMDFPISL